jgi:hypothetical protein
MDLRRLVGEHAQRQRRTREQLPVLHADQDGIAEVVLEGFDESRFESEPDVGIVRRGVEVHRGVDVVQDESARLVLEVRHLAVEDGHDLCLPKRTCVQTHTFY